MKVEKKYILSEMTEEEKKEIKVGMVVTTSYGFPTGEAIKGTIIASESNGFIMRDCSRVPSGQAWSDSWAVMYDTNSWVSWEEAEPEMNKKVEFDSVIIQDEKREQIKAAISQIDNNRIIFGKWGFGEVFEKGTAVALLFYGVPGTGKTLMAQAIADRNGLDLLTVGPAEIETSTPGGAERNIKRFFQIAQGKIRPQTGENDAQGNPIEGPLAKHVLMFDECDSLITNRDNVGIIMRGQINTLLSELEQFDGIVIFTTNSVKSLDPAMERRITTKIEFDFPDQSMRYKIWKRMIPKKAPIAKDVSFHKLAEFPFAGGNIKNIVLNAARHAAYVQAKKIDMACFLTAMEREATGLKAFEATYLADKGRPVKIGGAVAGIEQAVDIDGGVHLVKKDPVKKDPIKTKVKVKAAA